MSKKKMSKSDAKPRGWEYFNETEVSDMVFMDMHDAVCGIMDESGVDATFEIWPQMLRFQKNHLAARSYHNLYFARYWLECYARDFSSLLWCRVFDVKVKTGMRHPDCEKEAYKAKHDFMERFA